MEIDLRPLAAVAAEIRAFALPLIVKIDVEGHEAIVISQLIESGLVAITDTVFYEVDESWSDPAQLRTLLSDAGFSRFTPIGAPRHYDVLATR